MVSWSDCEILFRSRSFSGDDYYVVDFYSLPMLLLL